MAIRNFFGSPEKTTIAHTGLVLPPLIVITLFCFTLSMTGRPQKNQQSSAAKQSAAADTSAGLSSSLEPKQTLEPVPVDGGTPSPQNPQPAAAGGSTPSSGGTGSSQPNAVKGSGVQPSTPASIPKDALIQVAAPVTRILGF